MSALESVTTVEDALSLFDSLPAVQVEEVLGAWRGSEVPTGHPLDGLLDAFGWHGKRFDGPDDVHPLVFAGRRRGLFEVNPAVVPTSAAIRLPGLARTPLAVALGRVTLRLTATRRPKARLRSMEYRGVTTASLSYDTLPVHDHLRRLDADTLLGVMDQRGLDSPFVFALRRAGR